MENRNLHSGSLKQFEYRLSWMLTQKCNFNCEYCNTEKHHSFFRVLSPDEAASVFEHTGVSWLILLTGGEPFLYPDFPELCKALTRNNTIAITTNLSHSSVYRFADIIEPGKVLSISASYHHDELKKHNLQDDFMNKCRYLQNHGFRLLVNFVAYPPNLSRIEKDIRMFHNSGIETIVYGYRGMYNRKVYPQAYSKTERDFVETHALDDTELMIARGDMNFYGRYCQAGSKYFIMKENGDLQSCFTRTELIGNLFEENIPLNQGPRPCPEKACEDYYFGRAAVTKRHASRMQMFRRRIHTKITKKPGIHE
ncbi:MAG: radical SAM protein [Bacteroidales bacterium]